MTAIWNTTVSMAHVIRVEELAKNGASPSAIFRSTGIGPKQAQEICRIAGVRIKTR